MNAQNGSNFVFNVKDDIFIKYADKALKFDFTRSFVNRCESEMQIRAGDTLISLNMILIFVLLTFLQFQFVTYLVFDQVLGQE